MNILNSGHSNISSYWDSSTLLYSDVSTYFMKLFRYYLLMYYQNGLSYIEYYYVHYTYLSNKYLIVKHILWIFYFHIITILIFQYEYFFQKLYFLTLKINSKMFFIINVIIIVLVFRCTLSFLLILLVDLYYLDNLHNFQ